MSHLPFVIFTSHFSKTTKRYNYFLLKFNYTISIYSQPIFSPYPPHGVIALFQKECNYNLKAVQLQRKRIENAMQIQSFYFIII